MHFLRKYSLVDASGNSRPIGGVQSVIQMMKTVSLVFILTALVPGQTPTRVVTGQISGSLPSGFSTGQLGVRLGTQPPARPSSFDCAADGSVVNSITGEPIVRAHVNFNAAGMAYSTATDSSGKWTMSALACAPGSLQVTRPGFLQRSAGGRGANTFIGLSLTSGSPVHDLKTELVPQAVAWGKVQDSDGDPVQGVQVMVLAARVVDGKPRFQQAGMTNTNDLGEYRIANLSQGKYILCAHQNQSPGLVQSTPETIAVDSCYPGPLEGGAASATEFPAGHETKADFTLNQIPPVHVRGTISGLPEGRGIGINLIRRNINSDFSGNMPGAVRDGKFDFRVPPGSYMLTADYFEAGKRLTARVPIDAGSADIDNVAVHLDSGFTVSGIVHAASQSAQTPSLPQFGINLRPSEPVNGGGQVKWESDHTTFTVNDLLPGTYRVDVFPPSPYYVKSATLGGQDMLGSEVTISQSAGPIVITLSDDGGSIEGDVVDAGGQPAVAGIMLLQGTRRVASLTAQASGHFKLQNLAPGDYTIYAWDDQNLVQYAVPEWMRRYGGGGLPVSVMSGQNAQIKLTRQIAPE